MPSRCLLPFSLSSLLYHRLCTDSISFCRIVNKYMSNCPKKFTIFNDGRTRQECVKTGTTFFLLFHLLFYIPYHNHSFLDGLAALFSVHYLMTSCRQLSGNSRIGITPSYSDQTFCLEVSLSETASSPQSSQPLLQPDQNRSNLFSRIGLNLQQHSIK